MLFFGNRKKSNFVELEPYEKWCKSSFGPRKFSFRVKGQQEKELLRSINYYHYTQVGYHMIGYLVLCLLGIIILSQMGYWLKEGDFVHWQNGITLLVMFVADPLTMQISLLFVAILMLHGILYALPKRATIIMMGAYFPNESDQQCANNNLIFAALRSIDTNGGYRNYLVNEATTKSILLSLTTFPNVIRKAVFQVWLRKPTGILMIILFVGLNIFLLFAGSTISQEEKPPISNDSGIPVSPIAEIPENSQAAEFYHPQVKFRITNNIPIPLKAEPELIPPSSPGTSPGINHGGGKPVTLGNSVPMGRKPQIGYGKRNFETTTGMGKLSNDLTNTKHLDGIRAGGNIFPSDYSSYL
jgi:hypothetical protein